MFFEKDQCLNVVESVIYKTPQFSTQAFNKLLFYFLNFPYNQDHKRTGWRVLLKTPNTPWDIYKAHYSFIGCDCFTSVSDKNHYIKWVSLPTNALFELAKLPIILLAENLKVLPYQLKLSLINFPVNKKNQFSSKRQIFISRIFKRD